MRRSVFWALAILMVLGGALTAAAQSVPAAFLLYPNYRGLIFSDRQEILVEAPTGASVTVRDKANGGIVATTQSAGGRARIATGTLTQDHVYTVTVQHGGGVIGQWDVRPVPAARRGSMNVSFDPQGRLLLHGKRRFALGVYDSGLNYSSDPNYYEQTLFGSSGARQLGDIPLNLYLNYWWGNAPMSAMNPLMDVLQKHGMMYLQTGNCFADGSHTRTTFAIDTSDAYVGQFGAHPGAAGYYIMDECTDRLIPETIRHHQRLAGLDPDSMTLAVTLAKGYVDPRKWVDAADVIGTDPYPLYGKEPTAGYTHFQVADYVAYTKAAVRDTRPTIAVLQFFKFTSDSRYPTAAELRAHAVMSLVEGARGIFWWDIGTNGIRKNADATTIASQMGNLRTLVKELAALEPVLVADDVPGALVGNSTRASDALAARKAQLKYNISVEWLYSNKQWYQAELDRLNAGDTSWSPMLAGAATIRTKVKVVGGKGYVFAYNYKNTSTPVTFTWYQAPGTITENRSRRTYAASGSSWSDTLGPYEARIYVLSNGGANPPGGSAPAPAPSPSPTSPTVSFTNPTTGASVTGTVTVSLSASGGTSPYTYKVEADATTIYTGTNPTFSWNTTTVANGTRSLKATVTDSAATKQTATASITVNVSNATASPSEPAAGFTAAFSYPGDGAAVSGTQSIGMSTTAPWGQAKTFTLSANDTVLSTTNQTGTTYWYYWDTKTVPNGTYTLKVAVTYNGATATATRTVSVSNGGGTASPAPSPLSASITDLTSGATVSGTQTITVTAAGGTAPYSYALSAGAAALTGSGGTFTWDTTNVANGTYTVTATVTDSGATRQTATVSVTVTVANATFAASFSYPAAGITTSGTQSIGMATTAPWGQAKTFTLSANGRVLSTVNVTGTTYWYYWNTTTVANGTYTLTLAVTSNGETATTTRTITIRN